MRRWPAYATGGAVLAACLALHLVEPAFVRTLTLQTNDAFLRTAARPPQSDAVALLDIDDESLARLGQWPWPRHVLARLVDRLWEAGAAVVVFDVVFAEPDRTAPPRLRADWQAYLGRPVEIAGFRDGEEDFDGRFAAALARGPSVLGCFLDLGRGGGEPPDTEDPAYRGRCVETGPARPEMLPRAVGAVVPIPELAAAAGGVASINTLRDFDNVVRRTPLVFARGSSRLYPSLALEAIRLYAGAPQVVLRWGESGAPGARAVRVRNAEMPVDANARLVLNFRSARFPAVAAWAALEGRVPEDALRGRIVFVGTSAAGLQDLVATPLSAEFPGVEVQATAADNLLAGDALRAPYWLFFAELAGIAVGGGLLVVLVARARALIALAVFAAAAAATLGLSRWGLARANLLALPAQTLLTWTAIYGSVTTVRFWLEERARHRVRSMFSTMVSGDVLRYMEDHPDSFSLSGERREVTVVFTDLTRFTPMAERLDPAALSELMNAYLTPMTEIVLGRRGFVNKYNGDAIMAVWGVPYALADHAREACLAALEQLERLDALRDALQARFGFALRMRAGINSGVVTAGNMGSRLRFEYTVLGDAVNLASRLEPANKEYGTLAIAGEATVRAAGAAVETRLLDRLTVYGKTQAVDCYELLGRAGAVAPARREAARRYEDALRAHWERRWDEALAALDAALAAWPADEPARLLQARVGRLRAAPPPDDWTGAHVLTFK